MNETGTTLRRTALFVDFDNMFTGLRRLGGSYADDFGRNPGRVVDWLRSGTDAAGPFQRRFLVMACYLNPVVYSDYRPFFASAGFRVVDCPSLTQQGKSSADIHLALDAVDALAHPTRYDEFVICSADADFTPLMVRLRAHDRRTTMLATGSYAAAYAAVCDEAVDSSALLAALHPHAPASTARPRPAAASSPAPTTPAPAPTAHDPARPDGVTATGPVRTAARAVADLVRRSATPLRGASVAHAAQVATPGISAGWGGSGSFTAFLKEHLPDLVMVTEAGDHWVYDPGRHTPEDIPQPFTEGSVPGQVCRVTRSPHLSGPQLGVLFQELAAEVTENGFAVQTTPGAVRERAATRAGIARTSVWSVVQTLQAAGVDLGAGGHSARSLAEAWQTALLDLCARAQLRLGPKERAEIEAWVLGSITP